MIVIGFEGAIETKKQIEPFHLTTGTLIAVQVYK